MHHAAAPLLSYLLMTSSCPGCGSGRTAVIETRLRQTGGRRRRHECCDCQHRWTTWVEGPPLPRRPRASSSGRRPPLTIDEVRLVLTSPLSGVELSRQLGCTPQSITAIRRGESHASSLPELPRRLMRPRYSKGGPSCRDCRHWSDATACGIGLPDPMEEGPAFAADCTLYQEKAGPATPARPAA